MLERNSELDLQGQSRWLTHIQELIDKVKSTDAPVFIWGESGTGKELVARNIHFRGARGRGRFVALNCGAIPDNLIESELFGHAKGAFTGALRDKTGLVEEASGGTLFLDEIGDLSLHLQAKLLRILEENEVRRVGENRTRPVDVRFVSATNKIIEQEVAKGNFREDLFYRLKIITLELKPLRERKEDILVLIEHFLDKFCRKNGRSSVYFSPPALERLLSYPWPGNVRELQNEIWRCLILCQNSREICEEDLSVRINPERKNRRSSAYDYFHAKADFEKRFLHQALSRFDYNRARTAKEIGLSRQGLFKLIKKHRIQVPRSRKADG
jgi:DNA-binding NtrC family response regulator